MAQAVSAAPPPHPWAGRAARAMSGQTVVIQGPDTITSRSSARARPPHEQRRIDGPRVRPPSVPRSWPRRPPCARLPRPPSSSLASSAFALATLVLPRPRLRRPPSVSLVLASFVLPRPRIPRPPSSSPPSSFIDIPRLRLPFPLSSSLVCASLVPLGDPSSSPSSSPWVLPCPRRPHIPSSPPPSSFLVLPRPRLHLPLSSSLILAFLVPLGAPLSLPSSSSWVLPLPRLPHLVPFSSFLVFPRLPSSSPPLPSCSLTSPRLASPRPPSPPSPPVSTSFASWFPLPSV